MRFELLVPLLITTVVAILGWYVVNYLNAQRELRNTIIELRIKYILEIYRRLERTMGKTVTRKVADDVEIALDDLQLLGTEYQVSMAVEHVKRLGGKDLDELNLTDLLINVRRTLREDLNLEPVEHIEQRHLRLHLPDDEEG